MKILGHESLSSKVVIGLKILFSLISIISIFVLITVISSIRKVYLNENISNNLSNILFFIIIFFTGVIALYIIYKFIKIFTNLKNNVLFSNINSKYLNLIGNSCFIISFLYLITAIVIFSLKKYLVYEFISYIFVFSITLMIIFSVSGIGIKILNEIYKKAIEYKEENDFTI